MSLRTSFFAGLLAAASIAALPALADEPQVPQTGSAQDITVPHALPGGRTGVPHGTNALVAPTGLVPQTGSRQGINPPHAQPGVERYSERDAHPSVPVTSPRGIVPETGSAQGANPPGSR